ncbi:MAG: hypothetical protein AB1938_31140 [Myxococcota bacterium]
MRSPASSGTSVAALERAGLRRLFAHGPVAFRRVDDVTATSMKVDGARLPRALVKGELADGQWLRFEKRGEAVSVHVDLRATLDGEERFNELLGRLAGGWLPVH